MKKNILLLNSLYYPNIGGVENSLRELSEEFKSRGYKVIIICSDRNFSDNKILPLFEVVNDCHIYRYESSDNYIKVFKNCISLIKKISSLNRYEMIVSRGYVTTFCALISGLKNVKYIVPSIIFIQDVKKLNIFSSITQCLKTLTSALLQVFGILFSKVYVFSSSMKLQTKKVSLNLVNAEIVRPGLNLERFHGLVESEINEKRRFFGVNEKDFIILCLGRFSEVKQFHLAIESLQYLDDESIKLLIVGEGPEYINYTKIIAELGLENRVLFFEATKTPEYFYQISDVFVMSSNYEAFGQVLIEATACSLPIVSFKPDNMIRTSVKEIYDDFPSLIHYTELNNSIYLAQTISDIYSKKIVNDEFNTDRNNFLKRYSWSNLVTILSEDKK